MILYIYLVLLLVLYKGNHKSKDSVEELDHHEVRLGWQQGSSAS